MVLHDVDDLDDDLCAGLGALSRTAATAPHDRAPDRREVDVGEGGAREDGRDALRRLEERVREGLGRGAAVTDVVLDAEVLVGAAGVVRRRQDNATERHAALAIANDGRDGRRREEAVLADPHAADTVCRGARGGGMHESAASRAPQAAHSLAAAILMMT